MPMSVSCSPIFCGREATVKLKLFPLFFVIFPQFRGRSICKQTCRTRCS